MALFRLFSLLEYILFPIVSHVTLKLGIYIFFLCPWQFPWYLNYCNNGISSSVLTVLLHLGQLYCISELGRSTYVNFPSKSAMFNFVSCFSVYTSRNLTSTILDRQDFPLTSLLVSSSNIDRFAKLVSLWITPVQTVTIFPSRSCCLILEGWEITALTFKRWCIAASIKTSDILVIFCLTVLGIILEVIILVKSAIRISSFWKRGLFILIPSVSLLLTSFCSTKFISLFTKTDNQFKTTWFKLQIHIKIKCIVFWHFSSKRSLTLLDKVSKTITTFFCHVNIMKTGVWAPFKKLLSF